MPYYKFGANDIFNNAIKTHPKVEFLILQKEGLLQQRRIADSGEFTSKVLHTWRGQYLAV